MEQAPSLVPQTIIWFYSLRLAMFVVHMGIAEDIHRILQTVVIVEEFQAA